MDMLPPDPLVAGILRAEGANPHAAPEHQLLTAIRALRRHLAMDVAFVSEFTGGRRVFRYVDSPHEDQPVRVGMGDPLEESFCQRVVDGRLPELIHDAAALAEARALPVTLALPVGAHLSVPIRLKNGQIYGTLCCFSFAPDQSLSRRDIGVLRVFADLAAEQIERDLEARRGRADVEKRVTDVLQGDVLGIVYQPIYHFAERRVVAFESLSRFATTPPRSPDVWFNEATAVGLGTALEIKAITRALRGLEQLPDDVYLSVNVGPSTMLEDSLYDALRSVPLGRVVLEVTEHAAIDHYADIAAAVAPLRREGLRIAVDDAGAGYASFRHVLSLAPDIIKLDISITRDIQLDPSRRALARALVSFADATASAIVAEGVETADELAVLQELGVRKAQGYFIGRPTPIDAARKLVGRALPLVH